MPIVDFPPIQVALPDVLAELKNLKPGVAFTVPPKLFTFFKITILKNYSMVKAMMVMIVSSRGFVL
jgi:hypothetical protein